jgi:hypothetical protein
MPMPSARQSKAQSLMSGLSHPIAVAATAAAADVRPLLAQLRPILMPLLLAEWPGCQQPTHSESTRGRKNKCLQKEGAELHFPVALPRLFIHPTIHSCKTTTLFKRNFLKNYFLTLYSSICILQRHPQLAQQTCHSQSASTFGSRKRRGRAGRETSRVQREQPGPKSRVAGGAGGERGCGSTNTAIS